MKLLNLSLLERKALNNILSFCIRQYETSAGGVDYTELGADGLYAMQEMLSKVNDSTGIYNDHLIVEDVGELFYVFNKEGKCITRTLTVENARKHIDAIEKSEH